MDYFPLILAASLAGFAFFSYVVLQSFWTRKRKALPYALEEKSPYDAIEPVPADFDWSITPTIKIRPFKPKYHLSMSLENLEISDLIAVDNTYLDRLHIRRETMDLHPEATKQCRPGAEPAVYELYDWMISTYLPQRFPGMYKLTTSAAGQKLLNTVTNTHLPLRPASAMEALDILGANVDTDFLILYPRSKAPDGSDIYWLEAFITCFPAGFSTREKCGNPLAAIHAPVPGYAQKLEKSMDRFFAKIEVGRLVKRVNWSISTDDKLYSEGGNHMYGDDSQSAPIDTGTASADAELEKQRAEVEVEDCRLRCERQTLHRLPKSKALVFAFKTYLYTLAEVKAEGLGPDLVEAIDGLAAGSVPAMAFYKKGVVWGEKVKEYLRS